MTTRIRMVSEIKQRHSYGSFAHQRRCRVAVVGRHIAEFFRGIERCSNAAAVEMAGPQTPQDSNLIVGIVERLSDLQCLFKGRICLWTRSLRPDQGRA